MEQGSRISSSYLEYTRMGTIQAFEDKKKTGVLQKIKGKFFSSSSERGSQRASERQSQRASEKGSQQVNRRSMKILSKQLTFEEHLNNALDLFQFLSNKGYLFFLSYTANKDNTPHPLKKKENANALKEEIEKLCHEHKIGSSDMKINLRFDIFFKNSENRNEIFHKSVWYTFPWVDEYSHLINLDKFNFQSDKETLLASLQCASANKEMTAEIFDKIPFKDIKSEMPGS